MYLLKLSRNSFLRISLYLHKCNYVVDMVVQFGKKKKQQGFCSVTSVISLNTCCGDFTESWLMCNK